MQFPANSTPDFVMIKGCYSNYSVVDRPWRAYNNIITVRRIFHNDPADPAHSQVKWTHTVLTVRHSWHDLHSVRPSPDGLPCLLLAASLLML